jgi:Zn-dependent protease with chaperone function
MTYSTRILRQGDAFDMPPAPTGSLGTTSDRFAPCQKERTYHLAMVIVSGLFWAGLVLTMMAMMGPFQALLSLFQMALMAGIYWGILSLLNQVFFVGQLYGNAVQLGEHQLPEVYQLVTRAAEQMGLKTPKVFLLQHNVLNAFTVKLLRKDYVVLFSEILEVAYQEGQDVVEYVIGHELGHVKLKHTNVWRTLFLLPGLLMPFLSQAFHRAREISCDKIGHTLNPQGALRGVLLLGAGKGLYNRLNPEALINGQRQEYRAITRLIEIFSLYPTLVNRAAYAQNGYRDI